MDPQGFFSLTVHVLDVLGVVAILCGIVTALSLCVILIALRRLSEVLDTFRNVLGGAILLGLEIFVAGDLIKTITQTPTIESVAVLGMIVLIRTVLSFTIQIEIDGVVPWKKALLPAGPSVLRRAVRKTRDK